MSDKKYLLKCDISKGMFRDEVAIKSKTADGRIFSFFINSDYVINSGSKDEKLLEVDLYNINGSSYDILLPTEPFETERIVTVGKEQLVISE